MPTWTTAGLRRGRVADRSSRPSNAGFTLLEPLIAIVLLTGGVLALVSTSAASVRLAAAGARRAAAATLVSNRIEALRRGCPVLSGSDSVPGVVLDWQTVRDTSLIELAAVVTVSDRGARAPHREHLRWAAPC